MSTENRINTFKNFNNMTNFQHYQYDMPQKMTDEVSRMVDDIFDEDDAADMDVDLDIENLDIEPLIINKDTQRIPREHTYPYGISGSPSPTFRKGDVESTSGVQIFKFENFNG